MMPTSKTSPVAAAMALAGAPASSASIAAYSSAIAPSAWLSWLYFSSSSACRISLAIPRESSLAHESARTEEVNGCRKQQHCMTARGGGKRVAQYRRTHSAHRGH